MNQWSHLRSWLRATFQRSRTEREMNAELHFHLETYAKDLTRSGIPLEEALRRARIEFGSLERAKEECRDARGVNFLDSLLQDIRFGFRQLRKSPGFTSVIVLTLALGIGANSAIFTVINAVMLRTLPVQHPEQLVIVGEPYRVHSWGSGTPRTDIFSYPLYREVRDNNKVFSSVLASAQLQSSGIVVESGVESIHSRLVSENYFETLGVEAVLGRTFTEEDGRTPGADAVLVISYEYWQRRFSGDPVVVGRQVRLNNYPFVIIGVAPRGFFGDVVGDRPDVWAPVMMQPQLMAGHGFLDRANVHSLLLIGRLKPRVSLAEARADINAVVDEALRNRLNAELSSDDRDAIRKMKITVPLSPGGRGLSKLRQEFEAPLLLLLAMVVLVLLVACVNVANLMLARSAVRQQEMAVRSAMGAGPLRIVRQLLTESLVLASLGGALGLVLARKGAVLLVNLANTDRRTANPIALGLDWRVLGFTAIVCIAAAVLFGLAPALRSLRQKLNGGLRGSVSDFGASKSRVRYVLPAIQIALGVLVLMTASLLVRSLQNLEETDLGYSRDRLLMVPVDLAASGYRPAEMSTAAKELLLRFASLPGVQSATVSCNGLFSGGESTDAAWIDGMPAANDEDNVIADDQVGPSYFTTIGAPIILGREITAQDVSAGSRVAVVNEAFARFYFKERNPLGHKIYIQDSDQPNQAPYEIVGVVRDVHDHSVRDAVRRRMYAPLASALLDQTDILNFEIHAVGNPAMLINSVRTVIRALNPDLVVGNVETAARLVTDSLSTQVVVANLSTFFGVLVLILVCVGLYGIMSFNVAARTREIGLRMALGALPSNLIWMVVREAWLVVVIGLTVGIPVGIAASQWFKAMLFDVNKSDPFSIATAVMALIVICVCAAVVPVRRATHVDPMVALRHE